MVEPSDELWFCIMLAHEKNPGVYLPYIEHMPGAGGTIWFGPFVVLLSEDQSTLHTYEADALGVPDHIQTEAFLYLSSQMRKRADNGNR